MTRRRGPETIATLRRKRTEARRILAAIDAESGRTLSPGKGAAFDKCVAELDWTARRLRELEQGD